MVRSSAKIENVLGLCIHVAEFLTARICKSSGSPSSRYLRQR